MNWIFGGRRGGVIPGSMPNPAVKPSIADGTAEAIRGRAGRRRKSCLEPRVGSHLWTFPRLYFRLRDDYEGSRVCRRQPHRRKGDSRRGDVRNVVRSGGVAHWESEDLGSQNV